MTRHVQSTTDRRLCWDEQNRLQGVKDNRYLSYYQYDAGGDRTYKLTGKGELQNISGNWQYYYLLDNATLYASPYLVATDRGYTKHYYAESERIASRIGGGGLGDALGSRLVDEESFSAHQAASAEHFDAVTYCLGADAQPVDDLLLFLYDWRDSVQPEDESYWYHPDHLGSSSWITDKAGKAVQHLHYLPWGEDYVNQRTGSFSSMYTFSAKERDSETGLSYFGARYYSSDLSIWLSVDPMSDKYPSMSPYIYCANNPVKLVDPNGEEIVEDKPPGKLAELLRSWDRAVSGSAENRQFEGGGDGANAGTMTKHDVDVAVAVGATMLSGGAALGTETAVGTTFAIVSTVNNIDDATVNSAGQTVSQRATANNEGASNAVTGLKTAVSVISVGVSGNNVRKVFKEAKNEGTKVIKKNVSTFARNVADVATNLYGAVTSLFRKK